MHIFIRKRNSWGLTRAPQPIVDELKKKLHDNIADAPMEGRINVIENESEDTRPLFIRNHELNRKVLDELRPMHEEWAGVDLVGEIAYGLRGAFYSLLDSYETLSFV